MQAQTHGNLPQVHDAPLEVGHFRGQLAARSNLLRDLAMDGPKPRFLSLHRCRRAALSRFIHLTVVLLTILALMLPGVCCGQAPCILCCRLHVVHMQVYMRQWNLIPDAMRACCAGNRGLRVALLTSEARRALVRPDLSDVREQRCCRHVGDSRKPGLQTQHLLVHR